MIVIIIITTLYIMIIINLFFLTGIYEDHGRLTIINTIGITIITTTTTTILYN